MKHPTPRALQWGWDSAFTQGQSRADISRRQEEAFKYSIGFVGEPKATPVGKQTHRHLLPPAQGSSGGSLGGRLAAGSRPETETVAPSPTRGKPQLAAIATAAHVPETAGRADAAPPALAGRRISWLRRASSREPQRWPRRGDDPARPGPRERQMRKLRNPVVQLLAQEHAASQWQSQEEKTIHLSLIPGPYPLYHILRFKICINVLEDGINST
ncbi:uncharacterized protein LOC117882098 [Trachemys scripta elegans]|uniref:uncharacterized protein LOC117882098 n=1 Tax=Trachemys scripta elegans TaxID=31138 RepID=UPI00155318F2|nr:uncharacterized protein LOC117882098 [Trachemys scripta elegans]